MAESRCSHGPVRCTLKTTSHSEAANPNKGATLELSLCGLQGKIMEFQHARILYAEDDADTCELVTVLLAGENCQVIATESHDEALRLARSEHFDLYLIDNWTPGISGVGLCGQLREF